MPYYVFAWIASILFGIVAISTKFASKYSIKNPWLLNMIWSIGVAMVTATVAFQYGVGWPAEWGTILLVGLLNAGASISFFVALYQLDISALSPLYNLRTPFSILLASLILGEVLVGNQFLLIAIIVIAGMFVTYDEHLKLRAFFRPIIFLAVIGVFFSAASGVVVNRAIASNGYWSATLWPQVVTALVLLGTYPLFKQDIATIGLRQTGFVAALAIGEVLGILALNKALEANVGITSTIVNLPLSMVITVAIAWVAPKLLESHPAKVYLIRLVAAGVMIAAATRLPR